MKHLQLPAVRVLQFSNRVGKVAHVSNIIHIVTRIHLLNFLSLLLLGGLAWFTGEQEAVHGLPWLTGASDAVTGVLLVALIQGHLVLVLGARIIGPLGKTGSMATASSVVVMLTKIGKRFRAPRRMRTKKERR